MYGLKPVPFKEQGSSAACICPLVLCWIAGLLFLCRSERFCSVGPATNGTILLPTRCVSADVPFVIRRPCPLAGDSLGLVSGGVVFRELSKLLHQEDALGAPCLDTVIPALRRRALAGAGILRTGVIRHFGVTLRLATPDIRPASADAFAVVGGGCTGRAHGCKAKQCRRVKGGADV